MPISPSVGSFHSSHIKPTSPPFTPETTTTVVPLYSDSSVANLHTYRIPLNNDHTPYQIPRSTAPVVVADNYESQVRSRTHSRFLTLDITQPPLRLVATLLILLPIPPMLAVIYMVVGHAILRDARVSSFIHASLTSSAMSGAVGGTVITLPLAIVFLLLSQPANRQVPDDFFEDDSSIISLVVRRWERWHGAYIISVILLVTVGAFSGPIGVASLPASPTLLDESQAAVAGILGGGVMAAAVAFVLVCGWILPSLLESHL